MTVDAQDKIADAEIRKAVAFERIAAALEIIANKLSTNGISTPIRQDSVPSKNNTKIATEPTASEPAIDNDSEYIHCFLKNKQIDVQSFSHESEDNETLDGTVSFMGRHYNEIEYVLSSIKRGIQNKELILCDMSKQIPLKNVIASSCAFCNSLHKFGFLENYKYDKKTKSISAAISASLPPQVRRFLCGIWLERYILLEVKKAITDLHIQHKIGYLPNAKVILPDEKKAEFDLLLSIRKNIYVFEAKSGDLPTETIQKLVDMRKFLQIDRRNFFLILAKKDSQKCLDLEQKHKIKVVNVMQFPEAFRQAIAHLKTD